MSKNKTKKSSGAKKEGVSRDVSDFQPLVLLPDKENWVILDFRLSNWRYMNFTATVRDTTHIFTIKVKLTI